MRQLLHSPTLWWGLFVVFGYWPVAKYMPSDPQIEGENALRFAVGLVITFGYLPAFLKALTARQPDFEAQLVLGVFVSWVGGAGSAAWILLWRLASRPLWMLQSNVNGWFLWMIFVGGILHVTAARRKVSSAESIAYRLDYRLLAVTMAIGLGLTAVVLVWRPDMSPVAEWLKQYLDDGL